MSTTLMEEAFRIAQQKKKISNKKVKADTSGKKQREAENIEKALKRKKLRDKRKKTVKKVAKIQKAISIPRGLKPYKQLQYALENGYLDNEDPKSYLNLPAGKQLPTLMKSGNRSFELHRIYPGMRALVFKKKVGNKKFTQSVKFYRTMSVNTKMSKNGSGLAEGIVNVTIFAPFYKIHELSQLTAGDILCVNGVIRLKEVSGGRRFHNLDLTLLDDNAKTYGSIQVITRPKMKGTPGLDNPKNQGGSIIFKND